MDEEHAVTKDMWKKGERKAQGAGGGAEGAKVTRSSKMMEKSMTGGGRGCVATQKESEYYKI